MTERVPNNEEPIVVSTELDTHADTCCIGMGAVILYQELSYEATVEGFSSELGTMRASVVSAALAYDDPITYTTFILIIHQALHFPSMSKHLLSPFQLRENGIVVNDTPLHSLRSTKRETHCCGSFHHHKTKTELFAHTSTT